MMWQWILLIFLTSPSWAKQTKTRKAKKADIESLENKYWAIKDKDFNVVQNRRYKKEGRLAIGLAYGSVINDSFSEGNAWDLSTSYFFTEKWGIELNHSQFSMNDNDTTDFFNDRFAVTPDHNKLKSSTSVGFLWAPIYAKMSLMEKQIIYFDMSFGLNIGSTNYEQVLSEGNATKSAPHIGLDISQFFFFTNRLAIRFNFRNQWSQRNRQKFEAPSDGSSRNVGDDTFHDTTMYLGVMVFL